jgi:hypothetical protein
MLAVLASFTPHDGVSAELVKISSNTSADAFASQLIEESGIVARPPLNSITGRTLGGLQAKGRSGGDGRTITVYFTRNGGSRQVCIVRDGPFKVAPSGWIAARYEAFEWCHAAFGLKAPPAPLPVVLDARR